MPFNGKIFRLTIAIILILSTRLLYAEVERSFIGKAKIFHGDFVSARKRALADVYNQAVRVYIQANKNDINSATRRKLLIHPKMAIVDYRVLNESQKDGFYFIELAIRFKVRKRRFSMNEEAIDIAVIVNCDGCKAKNYGQEICRQLGGIECRTISSGTKGLLKLERRCEQKDDLRGTNRLTAECITSIKLHDEKQRLLFKQKNKAQGYGERLIFAEKMAYRLSLRPLLQPLRDVINKSWNGLTKNTFIEIHGVSSIRYYREILLKLRRLNISLKRVQGDHITLYANSKDLRKKAIILLLTSSFPTFQIQRRLGEGDALELVESHSDGLSR